MSPRVLTRSLVVVALLVIGLVGVAVRQPKVLALLAGFHVPGFGKSAEPVDERACQWTGDFTISLPADEGDPQRYLRTVVVVETDSPRSKDELQRDDARVREAFISHASDLSPDEYVGSRGLRHGREVMRSVLRATHPGLPVRGIYFSEFVLR